METLGNHVSPGLVTETTNGFANHSVNGDSVGEDRVADTERDLFLGRMEDPVDYDNTNVSTLSNDKVDRLIRRMEGNPPRDRYHLVHCLVVLHGVAILIPWNMFINAKDYFENYKLAGNQTSAALTDYRTNFMSYIGMASQWPCFLMNFFNLFVQCKGDYMGIRILSSISVAVLMFAITTVLAISNTSSWPETFFWVTVAIAIISNAAIGMYQNSIFGMVAVLPMKYTNAVVFGNNVSGTLVALTNIFVLMLESDVKTKAIYYFAVAIVFLILAFNAYFATNKCKFYKHHMRLEKLKKHKENSLMLVEEPFYRVFASSFGRIFKQIYHLMFGVWFTFFVTLSLFPAVMSDVKPVNIELEDDFWVAIVCFLCFNAFATLGNVATEFFRWPSSRWVNILVGLRVAFYPLMMLSNFRPDSRQYPVYLPYDGVFIASAILFSFSNGYCSSLVMMYAPKCVAPHDASTAGMMMAMFLVLGVLCGINFSRVLGIVIGSG